MNQLHESIYVKRIAVAMYSKSFQNLTSDERHEVLERLEFMMIFQNT